MESLNNLHPPLVWSHFAALCTIPHPSNHEQAVKRHLIDWADIHGIAHIEDAVGNLILRKAASPGCESAPGVILQGHLDMVCQANTGTVHDFERDAINAQICDGWVVAKNTTLGADNGIGVALALAALEHTGLVHPALEVLLTVNEESGMDGARGLERGVLRGSQLINLDTEEWGHFYLGCAGGVDVEVRHACVLDVIPPDHAIVRLEVSGLRGGHSGIDIHLGRGNAIKLLAEALRDLTARTEVHLIELKGGTARNAVPREAYALCALPVAAVAEMAAWVAQRQADWRQRYAEADANVSLRHVLSEPHAGQVMADQEYDRLLAFLNDVQNGVASVSNDFPGVTDTSSNLGVVTMEQGRFRATFKVRSLNDDHASALGNKLVSFAHDYRFQANMSGAYPGWTPNPTSPLLNICQRVYIEQFGMAANLQVIHAGLECGLLAASHPQLDMISFGPDIRGAHAPGERVEIASVGQCWRLLKAVLRALAKP